jgi:hypothetical protein
VVKSPPPGGAATVVFGAIIYSTSFQPGGFQLDFTLHGFLLLIAL